MGEKFSIITIKIVFLSIVTFFMLRPLYAKENKLFLFARDPDTSWTSTRKGTDDIRTHSTQQPFFYEYWPDTLWMRTYGYPQNEYGRAVQQTMDGGYIITGYTEPLSGGNGDVYTIKVNSNGDTLWTRRHGGTNHEVSLAVQQTYDRGYIIVGEKDVSPQQFMDVYLMKLYENGDTMWTRTYGGSGVEIGWDVQQTSDSGYIIAGRTDSYGIGNTDLYLIKTDINGDTMWTRTYGTINTDCGYSVQQTYDGGYIVLGVVAAYEGDDVYLVKTDTDGDTIWTKTYAKSGNDAGVDVQQTSDSGYILVGITHGIAYSYDVYLIKTKANGDTIFTKTFGGALNDFGYSVEQTNDGGYIIAGATSSFGAGLRDGYVIKTDKYGNQIWMTTYGGVDNDDAWSVQQTSDKGYIIVGDTRSFGMAGYDVYAIKTKIPIRVVSPNGGEKWPGGSTINISWWCESPAGNSYRVLFSTDGGNNYLDTISMAIPIDSFSLNWTLPIIIDSTCRIKVQMLNSVVRDVVTEDESDSNFSILESNSPVQFSLISPQDSSILTILRPTFIWHASFDSISGLKSYNIYLNDILKNTGTDTFWTPNYDLSEGYYDWYVVAFDSAGNLRQSNETWRVIIDTTPPSVINLISPPNYGYLNDNMVNFIWHKATDNLSGIDHYFLQYAFDSTFSLGLVETTSVDTALITSLSDTIYYWRVKAFDVAGNEGIFSSIWWFEIDTVAPIIPILLSPINGIILTDTVAVFEWAAVTNLVTKKMRNQTNSNNIKKKSETLLAPVCYIIQIDTLLSFISPLIVDTLDTTTIAKPLYEHFPFYWRVKAYDWAGNQGPYANPDSFGIDVGPVIESTTVWNSTQFIGPFEILTKVTDEISGVDSVILYYKRNEDPDWVARIMHSAVVLDWFIDSIPGVDTIDVDTVRYYIKATDMLSHIASDPPGAPQNHYSFLANFTYGVMEMKSISKGFLFSMKNNPAKDRVVFLLNMPRDAIISLSIYDVCGRQTGNVVSIKKPAGHYEISWCTKTSAGVYFYTLDSPWQRKTGKFVITNK